MHTLSVLFPRADDLNRLDLVHLPDGSRDDHVSPGGHARFGKPPRRCVSREGGSRKKSSGRRRRTGSAPSGFVRNMPGTLRGLPARRPSHGWLRQSVPTGGTSFGNWSNSWRNHPGRHPGPCLSFGGGDNWRKNADRRSGRAIALSAGPWRRRRSVITRCWRRGWGIPVRAGPMKKGAASASTT